MTETPTTGPKYGRHSSGDVVTAALRILDDHGLPDLTMRRLAATLEVQPSALYWHFPNKQALLAAVADRIISRTHAPLRIRGDWKTDTRAEAVALRDALLAFRDGAEVVSSTLALGLGGGAAIERLAASIRGGGFDEKTGDIAAATMLHFILGHTSYEQQRIQADSLGVVTQSDSADPAQVVLGSPGAEAFDFGITLMLAGLVGQRAGRRMREPSAGG